MKVWTSVIIAVLIPLPLILTSVPVSTDFFPPSLWDILPGFFAYLVILIGCLLNFNWLHNGYFCFRLNILKPEAQLSYLEIVGSFGVLFFEILRQS